MCQKRINGICQYWAPLPLCKINFRTNFYGLAPPWRADINFFGTIFFFLGGGATTTPPPFTDIFDIFLKSAVFFWHLICNCSWWAFEHFFQRLAPSASAGLISSPMSSSAISVAYFGVVYALTVHTFFWYHSTHHIMLQEKHINCQDRDWDRIGLNTEWTVSESLKGLKGPSPPSPSDS